MALTGPSVSRTAYHSDNVLTMLAFRTACLDCGDCCGPCWAFHELQALPGTILRDTRLGSDGQRQMA